MKHAAAVAGWLAGSDDYRIFRPSDTHLAAIRRDFAADAALIASTVRTLTAGVLLAEEKGAKLIPQHALALSAARAEGAFPTAELDRQTAIAYLRREAIALPPDVPRGYVVVTFDRLPLGFVNNLGQRANNLYPDPWKIKTRAEI